LCCFALQDLSDYQYSQLPDGVFDLTNLHELSLAGNQLQHLPSEISRLTALRRLVLAGNLLTQLPDALFGLTSLEGLWVHGNMLRELPEQVGQLTKLKQLSLAGGCVREGWQGGGGAGACSSPRLTAPVMWCMWLDYLLTRLPNGLWVHDNMHKE
jgi:hypothetical protein